MPTTDPPRAGTDPLRRFVLVLAALIGSVIVLYHGRDLFILFSVSGISAFLLLPLCKQLERWRLPTWLSALLCTLLLVASVLAVVLFVGAQYAGFGSDLPALKSGLAQRMTDLQRWVEDSVHMSRRDQVLWINRQMGAMASSGGSVVMSVFSATGSVLAVILLVPIFTFFLLLLKDKFHTFFAQLSDDHSDTVLTVVVKISVLSRKWMKGVVVVILVLSVLNSIGFLLLGLKYAVLLGVTAALLNVVPYIGPWIGSLLPMLIALLTKDSAMYVLGALGVVLITQFIDNNFITPKVVGSSVSLNPLASMVALFAGGMLWGVVGLILAIPLTGMLKIICDEVPALKAWGFLLGEERTWPEEGLLPIPFLRRKRGKARSK